MGWGSIAVNTALTAEVTVHPSKSLLLPPKTKSCLSTPFPLTEEVGCQVAVEMNLMLLTLS
jgi:hypothetical protein